MRALLLWFLFVAALVAGVLVVVSQRSPSRLDPTPAHAVQDERAGESPAVNLDRDSMPSLESSRELLGPMATATPDAPAAIAPQPTAAGTDIRFLDVPNGGNPAFERKYAGKSWQELTIIGQELRVILNDEFEVLANSRKELGLFDERTIVSAGIQGIPADDGKPIGMGRAQAMRWFAPGSGVTNVTTVWITETECPDYFARSDEFGWVAGHAVLYQSQAAAKK